MKTTPSKVKAKVVGRGGKHMGHPGKPAMIPPKFHQAKTTKTTKFPC